MKRKQLPDGFIPMGVTVATEVAIERLEEIIEKIVAARK
jgi:hypothetical protein